MATSHQRRRQRVRDLRTGIQLLSLGVVIATGIRFALWVHGLEQGRLLGERPPGVEGFLPISALMSLRAWLLSGIPSPEVPTPDSQFSAQGGSGTKRYARSNGTATWTTRRCTRSTAPTTSAAGRSMRR